MIRDNALAIAGILNPALGGKSIKPAQPAGTWEINEMSGYNYQKSTGADLYRRGLYVYWRRSTVYLRPWSPSTPPPASSASPSGRKPARPCNRSSSSSYQSCNDGRNVLRW